MTSQRNDRNDSRCIGTLDFERPGKRVGPRDRVAAGKLSRAASGGMDGGQGNCPLPEWTTRPIMRRTAVSLEMIQLLFLKYNDNIL